MKFDFLRHHDMDTVCDNIVRFLSADHQRKILLNKLRELGTFTKAQVGPEFGALLVGEKIEKIGKDQYKVK